MRTTSVLRQHVFLAYKYQLPISYMEFFNPLMPGPRVRPYYYLRALTLPGAWSRERETMEIGEENGLPSSEMYTMPTEMGASNNTVSDWKAPGGESDPVPPPSAEFEQIASAKLQVGAPVYAKVEYSIELPCIFMGEEQSGGLRVRPISGSTFDPKLSAAEQEPYHVTEGPLREYNEVDEFTVDRSKVTSFLPETRISASWSFVKDAMMVYPGPCSVDQVVKLEIEGSEPDGLTGMELLAQLFTPASAEKSMASNALSTAPDDLTKLSLSKVALSIDGDEIPILVFEQQANGKVLPEVMGWSGHG